MEYEQPSYLVENKYLPEELRHRCPVSCSIFNLFHSNRPMTGHTALLIATVLATMSTDEKRPSNLIIPSVYGEGKSEILKYFYRYPYANYFSRITYAQYLISFCGKYLKTDQPLGEDIPAGIKKIKEKQGKISHLKFVFDENYPDKVRNFFDIIHAGEGVSSISDLESLLQLWNALLEDGYWHGGTRRVGYYEIGSPGLPIRHGLILGCTLDDLRSHWIKASGTLSRTIVSYYSCLPEENKYILEGREPPDIKIPYNDFSHEVQKYLFHLNPSIASAIDYSSELSSNYAKRLMENIMKLVAQTRGEYTLKRAMNDRNNLLKGHAKLNKRPVVTIEDVIFVDSLTQSCRCPEKSSDGMLVYGNNLHFNVRLRQLLGYSPSKIVADVKDKFKNWDEKSSIYSDERINSAIKLLSTLRRVF